MKFASVKTLSQIASLIGSRYVGPADFPVHGANEIHRVEHGDIVFVDHPKYYDKALSSAATVVLINKDVECPEGKALLISDDPFRDFNKITSAFAPFKTASAMVAADAKIGEGTVIQPGVFIGNDVVIGRDCMIHASAVICDGTRIGDRVVIRNFGTFQVKEVKPKVGRNPKNPDQDVPIPARSVVKFKVGKELKDQVAKLTASK